MTADLAAILIEVADERGRQDEKWGPQNHPLVLSSKDRERYAAMADGWKRINAERVRIANEAGIPRDRNGVWDGVLLEEVYEALAETDDSAAMRTELIQAAAVLVAMIEYLDRCEL
jgi:hypothetical protein